MSSFAIGDEVSLPQGHRAILRWIGRLPGRTPVEFAGVEVIGDVAQQLGKHSGTCDGVQYFETEVPNTGLFVAFTQLVSANIKTPRFSSNPGSPVHPNTSLFRSPGLKTPGRSPLKTSYGSTIAANDNASPFSSDSGSVQASENASVELLSAQLQKMQEQRDLERQNHEKQRADYRQTLINVNGKVEELKKKFEAKIQELKAEHEVKLRSARRSSSLLIQPGASEVEEQRLALANMQNKLIQERTEKQDEIERLTLELENFKKLQGPNEDLERFVEDLAKSEQELKQLRSQLDNVDELKTEISNLRTRNLDLEMSLDKNLAAVDEPDAEEAAKNKELIEMYATEITELKLEIERLEHDVETRKANENRLEIENKAFNQRIKELEELNEQLETQKPVEPSDEERELQKQKEDKLHALESENEDLKAKISKLEGTNLSYKHELDELKDQQTAVVPSVPLTSSLDADDSDEDSSMDMTAGRKGWCRNCEREGHYSEQCPF